MAACSIYYIISWSSHKAKHPVRSIGAAEILAAGEAIDKGKMRYDLAALRHTNTARNCARFQGPFHIAVHEAQ